MPEDIQESYLTTRENRELIEASRDFARSLETSNIEKQKKAAEAEGPGPEPGENPAWHRMKGRLGTGAKIATDIGRGAAEFYKWLPGGVVGAANEFMQTMQDASDTFSELQGDLMDEAAKGPEADLPAAAGGFVDKLKAGSGQMEAPRGEAPQIPDVIPDLNTTTGQVLETLTTFVIPYTLIGKVIGTAKGAGALKRLGNESFRSMLAETLVIDPYGERVADLLHKVPVLQGPVTEFMKSNQNDSIAAAKLKTAMEGLLLGIPIDTIGHVVEALRMAKAAKLTSRMMEKPGTTVEEALEHVPRRVERQDLEGRLNDLPTDEQRMVSEERWIAEEMKRDPSLTPEQIRLAGRGAPKRAYTGSPNTFDKFDSSHIGTGEGNITYSRGLYFGENIEVGETYHTTLVGERTNYKVGEEIVSMEQIMESGGSDWPYANWGDNSQEWYRNEYIPEIQGGIGVLEARIASGEAGERILRTVDGEISDNWYAVRALDESDGDAERAIAFIEQEHAAAGGGPIPEGSIADEALRELREGTVVTGDMTRAKSDLKEMKADLVAANKIADAGGAEVQGGVYEVNLHVTDDEMLAWFEPISHQSEKVKEAVRSLGIDPDAATTTSTTTGRIGPEDALFVMEREVTGEEIYLQLVHRLGSEDAASQALRDAGIPGMRYPDSGSRMGMDQGHVNISVQRNSAGKFEANAETYQGATTGIGGDSVWSAEFDTLEEAQEAAATMRDSMKVSRDAEEGITQNIVMYDDSRIEALSRDGKSLPPDEAWAVKDDMLPSGGTPAIEVLDGKIHINWAHIDGDKDLKALLRDLADAQFTDINAARRGVQTWEMTAKNASQVQAYKKLMDMGEQRGVVFNDYETLAIRQLWVSSADKVKQLALAAEVGGPEDLFAFRRQMALHSLIQKRVFGVRAEQARALQQWRMPAGEGQEIAIGIDSLLADMGGEETSRRMAKMVSDLVRNGKDSEMELMAQGSIRLKSREALTSLWYAALLSGPHTHMRNIAGNSGVMVLQLAERRTAELIRQIKGGVDGVAAGEAASMFHADIESLKDMLRIVFKMKKMSETGFRDVGEAAAGRTSTVRARVGRDPSGALSAETWNMDAHSPWGRAMDWVSAVVDSPTRALAMEDEIFKSFGRRRALHFLSLRRSVKEITDAGEDGLEAYARNLAEEIDPGRAAALAKEYMDDPGMMLNARQNQIIQNPDEVMRVDAEDYAAYVTFTQVPAEAPDKLLGAWQQLPWGIGRITMPFRRTPVNLATYALERTPLAPLVKQWNVDMKAGGAARDIAQAKWALGSALWAASVDLAMSGYIVGAGVSQKERADNEAEDIQQNSVRLKWGDGPNDFLTLNYRGMEPIAATLGLASNMVEMLNASEMDWDEATALDLQKASVAAIFSVMNQLTSQQYMSGMANVFEVMSDPTRLGDRMVSRTAGAFVPAIVASGTRIADPYLRAAHNMVDSMKRRWPWTSEDLPFSRDRMGHKRDRRSGLGVGYDIGSPVYAKFQDTTPIDTEIRRLDMYVNKPEANSVGFDGAWASPMLGKGMVSIDMKKFPKAYDRYNELQGNATKLHSAGKFANPAPMGQHKMLNMLVSGRHPMSAAYAILTDSSDGGKAQAIRAIRTDFQWAARKQLMNEFPLLREEVIRKVMKRKGARP